MRVSYDPEADALYIRLIDDRPQCRNVCLTEQVALDFGPSGELVGIEVTEARAMLGSGNLPQIVLDHVQVAAA